MVWAWPSSESDIPQFPLKMAVAMLVPEWLAVRFWCVEADWEASEVHDHESLVDVGFF